MFCFRCGTALEKSFFQQKINWVCPKCRTRMMSVSALRTLLEAADIANRLWRASEVAFEENGSRCRTCGTRLRQVYLRVEENSPKIELDVCRKCQMFCFDPEELESLPVVPEKPQEFKHEPNRSIDLNKPMDLPADMPAFAGDGEPLSDVLLGAMGVPIDREGGIYRQPWVTYVLLLLCAAGFVISEVCGMRYVNDHWGFIPSEAWRCGGATFLTAAFLHTGVAHFAGNIYFLWLSGKILEENLRTKEVVLLFAVSLLSSKLFYLATAAQPDIPCVGASGFVAGFMACCAVISPCRKLSFLFRNSIGVRYLSGDHGIFWIELPVWFCFILWFIFQLVCAFFAPETTPVAFTSHLGGSLAGAAIGAFYRFHRSDNDL